MKKQRYNLYQEPHVKVLAVGCSGVMAGLGTDSDPATTGGSGDDGLSKSVTIDDADWNDESVWED